MANAAGERTKDEFGFYELSGRREFGSGGVNFCVMDDGGFSINGEEIGLLPSGYSIQQENGKYFLSTPCGKRTFNEEFGRNPIFSGNAFLQKWEIQVSDSLERATQIL